MASNSMILTPVVDFLANAVMAHLRAGHRPTSDEAQELNRFGLIDALRKRIVEDDLGWVWQSIDESDGWVQAFYLGLLQPFSSKPEVQSRLKKRWNSADTFTRFQLLWRMLEADDVDLNYHNEVRDLIVENWDQFSDFVITFHGSGDRVLRQGLRRLADSTFPDPKKWIYLAVIAAGAEDRDAARAVLELANGMVDGYGASEVAGTLLERFFNDE